MSLLKETFVTDEAEDASFDALPAGEYIAHIKKAEIKTNKAKTGEYISCQWEIDEADDVKYVGRIVFQILNISNPSELAQKIGLSELKKICEAFGISQLADTDELVGQPARIFLKIRPARDQYPESNEVAKVMPYGDTPASGDAPWAG